MKTQIFRTIIEPDDPRGFHGFVPLLPGVHTCGDTIEEVKKNLREAILCHVQGMIKDGIEVPQEEKALESVMVFQDQDFKRLYA